MNEMIENWVCVEEDEDIQNFEIDEEIEKILSVPNEKDDNDESEYKSDSSKNLKNVQEELQEDDDQTILTFIEADECFHNITAFATKKNVPDNIIQRLHTICRDIRKHSLHEKKKSNTSNRSIVSYFNNTS